MNNDNSNNDSDDPSSFDPNADKNVQESKQVGHNENSARVTNEATSLAGQHSESVGSDTMTVVCECGDASCEAPMTLSADQYERVRSEPAQFAVLRGHEIPDCETIIEEFADFIIVEKYGAAGKVANNADPRHHLKTCRVVVVDDIFEIRVLLKMLLALEPTCTVVGEAENGAVAVQVAAQTLPEVIVLDMEMPVMNGWQALPQLRQVSPTSTIIVFSGMVMDDSLTKRLHNLGADYIVRKGGDPTIIVNAVRKVAESGAARSFGLDQ
jgi:CheY-like chemotaxis protein